MEMVKTQIKGCGVRLDWKEPEFSGAPILNYKIEV